LACCPGSQFLLHTVSLAPSGGGISWIFLEHLPGVEDQSLSFTVIKENYKDVICLQMIKLYGLSLNSPMGLLICLKCCNLPLLQAFVLHSGVFF
jgi:hypothetical protein